MRRAARRGTIGRHAGHGDLAADVVVPALHEAARVLFDFLKVAAGGMRVQRCGHAALAAEQLVDGHARALALDVPERLVDA